MRNRQEGGLQNSLAEKIRKKYVPLTAIIAIGAGALAGCSSPEKAPRNAIEHSPLKLLPLPKQRRQQPQIHPSKRQRTKRLHSLSDLALPTKQRRYHRSQRLQPNRLSSNQQKSFYPARRS